ncbi:GNAT family N-acetyltransferase [Microbacterium lacticum]|uniref:GNAT family N-acetyltransferase n=1 Tax=Microbacterium lacticum TaxID=33885 RepID=UPI0024311196|nr:GNAT family N-acetyltransferase [Microbacterium lacticum]
MSLTSAPHAVRPYQPSDERGWLRCRVLSFLDTQYYDDVKPRRTALADPSIALVAVSPTDEIVGILDVEIDGKSATIDTIAVHPDHQGAGIASALLRAALTHLGTDGIATLDAWTREDTAANRWYQRNGFTEQYRYLHVYLSDGDDDTDFTTPEGLSTPVSVFAHGHVEDEVRMRERFRRVYVCRQYLLPIVQR